MCASHLMVLRHTCLLADQNTYRSIIEKAESQYPNSIRCSCQYSEADYIKTFLDFATKDDKVSCAKKIREKYQVVISSLSHKKEFHCHQLITIPDVIS